MFTASRWLMTLALVGCQPPAPATPAPTPVTPEPSPAPPPAPAPIPGAGIGEACGEGDVCAATLECVHYRGIAGARGPEFTSCEIRCADDSRCPEGRRCVTIADGPGRVCR